jgi:ABC-2 type transport system ATP-binding protein
MLRIDGLTKRYGEKTVLDGVSLEVPEGEIFGFVGANGAGKTTTMRIVMGVLEPTSGSMTWDGRPLTRNIRRTFGYMPEERGLYQKMKVAEQVRYFGELYGLSPTAAARETDALIERLALTQFRDREVQSLSLGNQQRAQLAVALVHSPRVLVLDEPFSGLDPVGVDALADLLLERRRDGVSIIFSSHQLELVERMIDALGIINEGRIVATGKTDEVRAMDQHRRLRVILRDTREGWAERVPGQVVESHEDVALIAPGNASAHEVLAALMREGQVEHFGWDQPRLADIFRKVVAA